MSDIDLLGGLNDEQRDCVTHVEGPLMIIAGAGTGKTTAVVHRIAWLIDEGHAKPEEILALTFTDKAAGEMEERVDRLLPYGYVDLQISTFHSFAEKLLRQYGAEIGLSRDFSLVNELDAWLIARQNFDSFELDYYRPLGNPTKYIRSLLTHFSRAKDLGVGPDEYAQYVAGVRSSIDEKDLDEDALSDLKRQDELVGAYKRYQEVLHENDSLDFGDLMYFTLKLLRDRPHVREQIRLQYKFLLVDEFQDTNDIQYEIVKELAAPLNNLTVVGDDDQSIYKFRGASLKNILRFEDDYSEATRVVLTKNYRSAQTILDTSHTFIQHNNPHRLEAHEERNLSKRLIAGIEGLEGSVHHIHASTLQEEVARVVEMIQSLRKEVEGVAWSDFAILVRSNSSGTDFATALDRHRIPYQFLALSGLYTKPVILDLLAFLRVIDDGFNSPSFYRLLVSPLCGVNGRTVMELNQWARKNGKSLFQASLNISSFENLDSSDVEKITRLIALLETLQLEAVKRNVAELYVMVARDSGYLEYINGLSERERLEKFGYLQQFHKRLKAFEKRSDHPVLHQFLAEFDHERAAGEEGSLSVDMEAGPDVVKIMTIHASKGLEFRYVFIVNMVAQRFPSRSKAEAIPLPVGLMEVESLDKKEAHIHEERRLCYVAMTRAKEGLIFTSADDYGGSRKRKISQFLHELGYEQPKVEALEIYEVFDDDVGPGVVEVEDATGMKFAVPKQFSFTQLAAFKTCPLQYKYAHIFKIPVMGKWTFSYGKTMHNTLQQFFVTWLERMGDEGDMHVNEEELFEMYKMNWLNEWYTDDDQREKYRAQGAESLKGFYKLVKKDPPAPFAIEQGFTCKFGKVVLKGRIDRMDVFEDGIEIIDYKTGKPKVKLTKDDKEQLLLYQLAARDVLGLNVKKLTFHYLQDNSLVSFLGTDKQLLDLEESIVDRVQRISSSNFDPSPGFHCKFCDFADICEYRQ
jgi:DNA helicase II / ATP-dependent DNA helicase PcrA